MHCESIAYDLQLNHAKLHRKQLIKYSGVMARLLTVTRINLIFHSKRVHIYGLILAKSKLISLQVNF